MDVKTTLCAYRYGDIVLSKLLNQQTKPVSFVYKVFLMKKYVGKMINEFILFFLDLDRRATSNLQTERRRERQPNKEHCTDSSQIEASIKVDDSVG